MVLAIAGISQKIFICNLDLKTQFISIKYFLLETYYLSDTIMNVIYFLQEPM